MAHMKEFAIWLANCVHRLKMTDKQIFASAKNTWKITDEIWLKEQIDIVNASEEYVKLSQRE